jgi:glutamyl-tRNA synthetase
VRESLKSLGLTQADEKFWLAVRPNLYKLSEARDWWKILYDVETVYIEDKQFMQEVLRCFPDEEVNKDTWSKFITAVREATGRKGQELFMPIRLALTGMSSGPELKNIIELLGKNLVILRLSKYA